MKNARKSILLAVCLILLATAAVMGTLAYFTSEDTVTNTFTIGNVGITLTESEGTYIIVPGHYSVKKPQITVSENSEDCYVYALVDNQLMVGGKTVATPNVDAEVWTLVKTEGSKTLYRHNAILKAENFTLIFEQVNYSDSLTKTQVAALENKTITVSAYAHQSENVTVDEANTAAIAWAFPAANS